LVQAWFVQAEGSESPIAHPLLFLKVYTQENGQVSQGPEAKGHHRKARS